MSSIRNFQFRKSPRHGERGSRYLLDAESVALPQGVPVVVTGDNDGLGRAVVELAAAGAAKPLPGQGGILVYEQFRTDGVATDISTYSDFDTVPPGKGVQVVRGQGSVKVAYRNTQDSDFFTRANYPKARVMVAGIDLATPTTTVGELLTPGVGNDTDGYWDVTTDAGDAWLVITGIDSTGWVECELNF